MISVGCSTICLTEVVTCVSELAYNLFFHTQEGGVIEMSIIDPDGVLGIKITSHDNGPGIKSVTDALEDGFSTNGGLGGGLPGVKRLMDDFQIFSSEAGTSITCVKWCT
ncbi:MAG: ATP-binding protein [Thalassotalea sp.]|nr:ATP-binding protein [Thalassotalea sp.]